MVGIYGNIIPLIVVILEMIGLLIILQGTVTATIKYVKSKFNYKDISHRIELAKAMDLGLQYLLVAEVISALIIGNLKDFWLLAGVTILRIVIGIVLHWEMRNL